MSGCHPKAAPTAMATPKGNFSGPIVIDPITRIEGHLRIEVEVNEGKVSNAWSSAQLFRGLEIILKGRDPQDAQHFTQRTCGVCTYTHALASTRCVENALEVHIPENATLIRNLVLGAQYLHDHIVHFYHLHALDWVDVAAAINADPLKAAQIAAQNYPGKHSAEEFKTVQKQLKDLVGSGQLGIFTNAYFLNGHDSYYLTPEVNLIATTHYLQALRLQVKAARMMAVFGAKNPHTQFTVVGGVTCYDSLRPERIKEFEDLNTEVKNFVEQVYIPDLLVIGSAYKDWASIGGCTNFMSFGDFPTDEYDLESRYFPPGVIMNRNLGKVDPFEPQYIEEHLAHSWYKGSKASHPYEGVTDPQYTSLEDKERYSWMKAPRYRGEAMEVGPLAHILVAYGRGHQATVAAVDMVLAKLGVGKEALFSTLGRTAARGIETLITVQEMEKWIVQLKGNLAAGKKNICAKWDMKKEAKGVGFVNAPRGALSHWIRIEDGKIGNFQLVVPSTWNLGPRCAAGKPSAVEEALMNTPVFDAARPVEILRTVHSFDPCIACGVHVIDSRTNEVHKFKIL
jgi:[NiFe] hydrogenase large subunit